MLTSNQNNPVFKHFKATFWQLFPASFFIWQGKHSRAGLTCPVRDEVLQRELANAIFYSHSFAFDIHPCCEDDSSQLWQRECNVVQLPQAKALGVIWVECSFYSEARFIISWRKQNILVFYHCSHAIWIISITLEVTAFVTLYIVAKEKNKMSPQAWLCFESLGGFASSGKKKYTYFFYNTLFT